MGDFELRPGGLPVVSDYVVPESAGPCRAEWTLESGRAALLIHDMQEYFLRVYPEGSTVLETVVSNIRTLRDACDRAGIPVFYTAQTPHQDTRDRGLQADIWGPGMRDDVSDSAIIEALSPSDDHEVLRKWRYSAFQRSNLHPMLMTRGRDQLIVVGVYAQIGCLLTAAEAFMLDVQPFFPVDAVADFSLHRHRAAIEYVAQTCGRTCTTNELLEWL